MQLRELAVSNHANSLPFGRNVKLLDKETVPAKIPVAMCKDINFSILINTCCYPFLFVFALHFGFVLLCLANSRYYARCHCGGSDSSFYND